MSKVHLFTSFIGTTGYANHAKNFARALNNLVGLKITNWTIGNSWNGYSDEPHNGESYLTEGDKELLIRQTLWANEKDYVHNPIYTKYPNEGETPVNIVLEETNHHYFYDDYSGIKIAYNVWETTRQPDHFFKRLLEYDQIWVATEWQKQYTLMQGAAPEKVKVVPEAVDGTVFHPKDITWEDEKFRFLIFGRWEYRKATREIIEAFNNVFSETDPVELVLSVNNPFSIDGLNSTEERLEFYGLNRKNIKVLEFLSREEYIEYLQKGHVFVSCARSEGWNLPLIEAMACGTPSIYSDCSGQLEFADGKGIAVSVLGERPAMVGEGKMYTQSPVEGNYYEPDFKDLEAKLRYAYENYKELKQKAVKESEELREQFTWEKAAEKAYTYLQELAPGQYPLLNAEQKDYKDDFAYVTCGNVRYMPVIEKMVQSLLEFSDRKVLVYGINCDVPFDYPNLEKRRLDIRYYSEHDKWYWKQHCNVASCGEKWEHYVWIDGDVVVNHNVDNIEKHFSELENYPISDIHVQDEFFGLYDGDNSQLFNQVLAETYLNGYKGEGKYDHACFYIYNKACKWFFEELLQMYYAVDLKEYRKYFLWNDEGIQNFLKWKYNFTKKLPLSNFDVSSYDGDDGQTNDQLDHFYRFWNEKGPQNFGRIYGYQFIPEDKSNILYFHGNKDARNSDKMIEFIKYQRDNNFHDSYNFYTDLYKLEDMKPFDLIWGGTLEIAQRYSWNHAIFQEIYNLRDYTPWSMPQMRINKGDTVVDLGGNIGFFTRYAHHNGAEKIITFEPDRRYYKLLSLNAPKTARLFNAAAGESLGTLKLTEAEHLGGSHVLADSHPTAKQYEVQVYTLDYLFETGVLDKIDFLKVDIEGAEIFALKGISDENLGKVKLIAMEYHHAHWNFDEELRHGFITRLNNLGFNSFMLKLGADEALQMIYFWK